MSRLRSFEGFGVSGVVVGVFLIWLGFRDQMCTPNSSVGNPCGPSFVLLIPGVILILIGLGLFFLGYQHQQSSAADADG
ncbi:hypothetical protein A4G99_00055 [Haladaptatus sp. R4]|uniref:hypothetical protein n=1 Tax=Haladaptatus sp. R4 TaxID=1679489 RepID=UPI0007B4609F|nr:hypothetical protein [Haladaptatus sp. R4]KZN24981.1 hypothetical protein A4G99_00055 [Haladaptatus sp. R4]